mgnify:FL=1
MKIENEINIIYSNGTVTILKSSMIDRTIQNVQFKSIFMYKVHSWRKNSEGL